MPMPAAAHPRPGPGSTGATHFTSEFRSHVLADRSVQKRPVPGCRQGQGSDPDLARTSALTLVACGTAEGQRPPDSEICGVRAAGNGEVTAKTQQRLGFSG